MQFNKFLLDSVIHDLAQWWRGGSILCPILLLLADRGGEGFSSIKSTTAGGHTKMGEQGTLTFDAAERVLMSAAVATGTCVRHKFKFVPSDRLRN